MRKYSKNNQAKSKSYSLKQKINQKRQKIRAPRTGIYIKAEEFVCCTKLYIKKEVVE